MSAEGKGNGQGRGELSPEEREAFRNRSADIGRKLDVAKARYVKPEGRGQSRESAFGQAFKFTAELVVGVAAGVLLGGFLDSQFGTGPWLLVLFLILGFAAGLLNLVRGAQKAQAENEALQKAAPAAANDEDDDT